MTRVSAVLVVDNDPVIVVVRGRAGDDHLAICINFDLTEPLEIA